MTVRESEPHPLVTALHVIGFVVVLWAVSSDVLASAPAGDPPHQQAKPALRP